MEESGSCGPGKGLGKVAAIRIILGYGTRRVPGRSGTWASLLAWGSGCTPGNCRFLWLREPPWRAPSGVQGRPKGVERGLMEGVLPGRGRTWKSLGFFKCGNADIGV